MPLGALAGLEGDQAGIHGAPFLAEGIGEVELIFYGDEVLCRGCIGLDGLDLGRDGFDLHAVFPRATGTALYEYDYMFRFRGTGRLDAVQSALSRFPSARLAGAWRSTETSTT